MEGKPRIVDVKVIGKKLSSKADFVDLFDW